MSKLTTEEIIRQIEERKSGHSVIGVIGGPPCQAFSKGNVYPKPHDIRRELPVHYAKILKELNQKYDLHFFVFENAVAELCWPVLS